MFKIGDILKNREDRPLLPVQKEFRYKVIYADSEKVKFRLITENMDKDKLDYEKTQLKAKELLEVVND